MADSSLYEDPSVPEYEPEAEDWQEPDKPAEVDPRAPTLVFSHKARWRNEASERAAQLLSEHHAVFHDERDALVWVKDQRRAVIVPIKQDELAGLFIELNVQFRQQAGKLSAEVPAPEHLLRRVISGRFDGVSYRLLRGLAEGPHILGDGSIVVEPGYNEETRLWFPHAAVVELPEGRAQSCIAPHGYSQKVAKEAIDWLMAPLSEFPWAEPADRSVWLAYLFTLISRPAYDSCPFFLFDAPHSGSGKDLLLKCAERIAHGREARRTTFIGDPYQDENRIATMINDGYSTVVLGDLRVLDNKLLISLVTEGSNYSLRGFGTQSGLRIPYTMTLAGTGHNVSFKETDMIRRSLQCRLTPDIPNPEDRPATKLTESQLRRWFIEHRQRALSVALNTLRGYLRWSHAHPNEIPKGIDCKAFPIWSDIVQRAILWLDRPDPLESQIRLRKAIKIRAGSPVDMLIHVWWKGWRHTPKKASDFLRLLDENPDKLSSTDYAIREALQGLTDKPLKPKAFRAILSEKDEEVFEVVEDITQPEKKRRVRLAIYDYAGSNTYELRPL